MAIKDFWDEIDPDEIESWVSKHYDKLEAFLTGKMDVDEFDDFENDKGAEKKRSKKKQNAYC